jgi:hypothetical protein
LRIDFVGAKAAHLHLAGPFDTHACRKTTGSTVLPP